MLATLKETIQLGDRYYIKDRSKTAMVKVYLGTLEIAQLWYLSGNWETAIFQPGEFRDYEHEEALRLAHELYPNG